ncbi:hypothetical protein [Burkholderia glumae]|uniref:hypothetical protein n=1 Tax=Burkholderia glumae TaxID=337 RepID=UPI00214F9AE0|nr:hypothetical protein [Burkholderia glumae]
MIRPGSRAARRAATALPPAAGEVPAKAAAIASDAASAAPFRKSLPARLKQDAAPGKNGAAPAPYPGGHESMGNNKWNEVSIQLPLLVDSSVGWFDIFPKYFFESNGGIQLRMQSLMRLAVHADLVKSNRQKNSIFTNPSILIRGN